MDQVLQVLIHFFRKVESGRQLHVDEKKLLAELNQCGVSLADLEKTLDKIALWMESRARQPIDYPIQPHMGSRVFNAEECRKLSPKSRGFILKLQGMGILNACTRESIIDQLMDMDTARVRLSRTQWMAFQVLFSDAPPAHVAYLEWLLFGKLMAAQ